MKRLATAIAVIALVGTRAFAADMAVKMPVKAPPPPPPPVYSWTGFYVGANGGYGWNDPTVTFTPNDLNVQNTTCGFDNCPPPTSFGIAGGFGGLQAGYNWQFSPQWVAGVETDFDWSHIDGTGTSKSFLAGAPSNFTASQDTKWFGTVRARVGYLPTSNLLVYATGGFAYGRIDENAALNSTFQNNSGNIGNPAFSFFAQVVPIVF
jgi:outer membrane immunogenic protein